MVLCLMRRFHKQPEGCEFVLILMTASLAMLRQDHLGQATRIPDASGSSQVSPPSPPPLPQPQVVAEGAVSAMAAPRSPYITSGEEPILGDLLLDFLHLFGEDFDAAREGFSVRGGGFRFRCHDKPPHPQAGDPIVIEVKYSHVHVDF